MEFIKKNKSIILAVAILIAVIAAIFIVKDTIMFDENEAIYGNRLEGIDKVKISGEEKAKIKDSLKEQSKKVEIRLSGKVINVIVETIPELSLEDAKKMGDKVLECLSEDEKNYYDIQMLIDNSENKDQYPIIGYKHKSRGAFTWTRDREKTES